jgi:hypothetical protein
MNLTVSLQYPNKNDIIANSEALHQSALPQNLIPKNQESKAQEN